MSESRTVPVEVWNLYKFMEMAFEPFTSQQEQIKISLDLARKAVAVAPPQDRPAESAAAIPPDY